MPGLFEALNKLETIEKKHLVTIQGKEIEVSLEKKIEIQRAGEDKYMLKDGIAVLIPRPKTKIKFATLTKADRGYVFHQNNPFWVDDINDKGYVWQIESE